jgi:ABC-type sugar transport system ATPase subunit
MTATQNAPLLTLRQISKTYGRVQALDRVDFDVYRGEVLALVGDNGAGKSTLAKVISGAHLPDSGTIDFDSEGWSVTRPSEAKQRGIEMLYQDLGLLENLAIDANVFLGREARVRILDRLQLPLMDVKRMARETRRLLDNYGLQLDAKRPVSALSGGQRQLVAIARTAGWGSKLIVMDEPTAALGVRESARVLELVNQLRGRDAAVVLISHNLEHVFSIADRIAVLRRGRNAGTVRRDQSSPSEIVHFITGAEFGLGVSSEGGGDGQDSR